MIKSFLISAALALLLQSCCVYHSKQNYSDKKISEFGIAPYSNRPTIQEEQEIR